jgi:hypothetical protein
MRLADTNSTPPVTVTGTVALATTTLLILLLHRLGAATIVIGALGGQSGCSEMGLTMYVRQSVF